MFNNWNSYHTFNITLPEKKGGGLIAKDCFCYFLLPTKILEESQWKAKKYENGWSVNLSFMCGSNESTNCCGGTSQSTTCT